MEQASFQGGWGVAWQLCTGRALRAARQVPKRMSGGMASRFIRKPERRRRSRRTMVATRATEPAECGAHAAMALQMRAALIDERLVATDRKSVV